MPKATGENSTPTWYASKSLEAELASVPPFSDGVGDMARGWADALRVVVRIHGPGKKADLPADVGLLVGQGRLRSTSLAHVLIPMGRSVRLSVPSFACSPKNWTKDSMAVFLMVHAFGSVAPSRLASQHRELHPDGLERQQARQATGVDAVLAAEGLEWSPVRSAGSGQQETAFAAQAAGRDGHRPRCRSADARPPTHRPQMTVAGSTLKVVGPRQL